MEAVPEVMRSDSAATNLPLPLDRFIGRAQEMAAVTAVLAATRLLTLSGAGGSGKTRLALQVATDLQHEFGHGVWWVELAALVDPLLVPQAVAAALGIPERAGCTLTKALAAALRPRHLLLVLDNCEHLVAPCAQLIEALLHSCPQLRVLVTSREACSMAGETIWPVPPLRAPDTYHLPPIEGLLRYEAVQLFLERARAALPAFALTPENASAVVQICRRLDGIPLAIELAAARLRVLSVEQIAARLDDALRLLTAGSRTALPRQQTLRATMDWSYGLLSEHEQLVFRQLSVFAGSFSLDAAEVVCAGEGIDGSELLDLLSRLVDKSLLLVEERRGAARYRLLETMRQYGQETLQRLGEADRVRLRHRDWCVDLAERAEPELLSTQQDVWLARLELDHDNLRAVLRRAREQEEAETVARIGAALWHFWLFRGYLDEGLLVLEAAAAAYAKRTALRARVLVSAAALAFYQNDIARASVLLEEGLDLARALDDRETLAYALQALGNLRLSRGEYEQALRPFEESLALLRELGNTRTMALPLANWGLALLALGEYERATALCEESLALARTHGSPLRVANSLTTLAIVVLEQGNAERARVLCEESLAIRRKVEDKGGSAHSLAVLGAIALEQGQYPHALAHYQESLALRQETGEQDGIATALEGVAGVAAAQGHARSAAQLFGAAEALRTAINVPLLPADRARRDRGLGAARAQVDAAVFEDAWQQGRAMRLAEAIAAAGQSTLLPGATTASAQVTTPSTARQPAPSGQHDFGLTAREIEVLRLVTVGLTTPQIAGRLIISPRTADAHLRSIYAKLGVTSRSAATRAALEHNLA